MKPESIRKFDLFYLASVAVTVVTLFIGYDAIVARTGEEGASQGVVLGPGVAIGAFVIGLLISLLLWWLVSAKRMALAKWIIVVFFVIGLFGLPSALGNGITLLEAVNLLAMALQAAAIWFLFRPDAKAYLAGSDGEGPQATG